MERSSIVCPNCSVDLPYYATGGAMTLVCWNCRRDATVLAGWVDVEYGYEPPVSVTWSNGVLYAVDTPAVILESLITRDLANGMAQCGACLEHINIKEKDCRWYKASSTGTRCMYWREACKCCDKVVIDDKEIN